MPRYVCSLTVSAVGVDPFRLGSPPRDVDDGGEQHDTASSYLESSISNASPLTSNDVAPTLADVHASQSRFDTPLCELVSSTASGPSDRVHPLEWPHDHNNPIPSAPHPHPVSLSEPAAGYVIIQCEYCQRSYQVPSKSRVYHVSQHVNSPRCLRVRLRQSTSENHEAAARQRREMFAELRGAQGDRTCTASEQSTLR